MQQTADADAAAAAAPTTEESFIDAVRKYVRADNEIAQLNDDTAQSRKARTKLKRKMVEYVSRPLVAKNGKGEVVVPISDGTLTFKQGKRAPVAANEAYVTERIVAFFEGDSARAKDLVDFIYVDRPKKDAVWGLRRNRKRARAARDDEEEDDEDDEDED